MKNFFLFLLSAVLMFCLPQPLQATPQVSISPQKENTAIVIPEIKGLIIAGVGVTILGMDALRKKVKSTFDTQNADILFATSDGNVFLPNNEDKAHLHKKLTNNRIEQANKANEKTTKPEQLLEVHKFERKDFVEPDLQSTQDNKKGKATATKKTEAPDTKQPNGEGGELTAKTPDANQPNGEGEK
jgi:hypothetical protein